MERCSLEQIKNENFGLIFDLICDGKEYSRAEISEMTGISLMTVGKVTDSLLRSGIINEHKQQKDSAGRKSAIYSINQDRGILVYDLASLPHKILAVDLLMNVLAEAEFFGKEDLGEAAMSVYSAYAERGGSFSGSIAVLPDIRERMTDSESDLIGLTPDMSGGAYILSSISSLVGEKIRSELSLYVTKNRVFVVYCRGKSAEASADLGGICKSDDPCEIVKALKYYKKLLEPASVRLYISSGELRSEIEKTLFSDEILSDIKAEILSNLSIEKTAVKGAIISMRKSVLDRAIGQ